MTATVFQAENIPDEYLRRWTQLQSANPELDSPFFHPEFTRNVAAVRGDVEVAVLEADGEPVGFFPYQRTRRNVGLPVGGVLSDFHGVIAAPGSTWNAAELVRDCRLSAWRFDHLPAAQQPFQPHHWHTADSAFLDLQGGFEAYHRQRREAGSSRISGILGRAERRAARELGPVRFLPHTDDPQVFRSLVEWKSRQYAHIRSPNHLTPPWTMALVDRLLARRDPELCGMLSAVYLGDRLAAVHLGIRCRGVLHCWFSTYDEGVAKYSPGLIMLVELAKAAQGLGIQRMDLGKGSEAYKASLRSGGTLVAEGAVGLGLAATVVGRTWLAARHWMLSSRFRVPARAVYRSVRGLFLAGASKND